MKIVKLMAENFKKLKAIEIKPTGDMVVISGKNGAGKSSILDAIQAALSGKEVPEKPIRKGQKSAKIEMDCGEYTVQKTITEKGGYLKVINKEGMEAKSPQAFVEKVMGTVSIDPMGFLRMKPAEQRTAMLSVLGISVDEINKKIAAVYADRTIIGREKTQLSAQLASMEHFKDAPEEEIDPADVLGKIQDANNVRSKHEKLKEDAAGYADTIKGIENEIAARLKQVEDLRNDLKEIKADAEKDKKLLAEIQPLTDEQMAELEASVHTMNQTNGQVRANRLRVTAQERVKAKAEEYDAKTAAIKKCEDIKAKMLADANFPLEGLSVSDDGITMNDIPLEQLSQSEKIKVSIGIAMLKSPALRVIRIVDGSLLDSESMDVIEKIAAEKDYQVWIEVVDESGKVGFYVEDGEVK